MEVKLTGRVVLAIVAVALLVMALSLRVTVTGEEGSTIYGVGNSGNYINAGRAAGRLARIALSSGVAPAISDDILKRVWEAVTEKAVEGDVDAAAVVFEVAAKQRKQGTAAQPPSPNP